MEKYVGLVKWFHDQAKNANYGFIQHAILGDLFFHENSIEQGQDTASFKENEVVVFISQASKKHEGKLEAVQVKLLSTEKDLNFLFNHFLSILTEKGKYSDYNHIQKAVHSRIQSLLEKTEDFKINDELFNKFQNFVNNQLQSTLSQDTVFLKGLFNVCKNFFPDKYNDISKIVELKINSEIAHSLWLEKYVESCQVDFISSIITSTDKTTQRTIFNRCSDEDKLNIFFKTIYNYENINTDFKLETIKEFLKIAKEFATSQYDKILNETLRICPPYYKLNLWLEDYHQFLQFEEFKLFTITLNPSDQKKFVKKVLKYIHEEKVNISIEELTSINIIDYETSKLAENIDNSKLDYSTSIILNTILELNSQIEIGTRKQILDAKLRIYDLILNQIKEPTDILEIKGYFDECEGRCSVSVKEIKDTKGKVIDKEITYRRNERQKAKLHPICDGRKATKKESDIELSEDTEIEFWWCANQKCYQPSRKLHKSDEWEKYTLFDFLTILKVPFKEKDFEIYLNLINKANRFLKHLKCRECNHILKPKNKSNYAFYGINDFHCTNETCNQKGNKIYLTHCLNGKCEQEIDSRDAVKCKPDGFESEKCGWYVCNYCHSCCSDEGIQRRMYILERTGQEYKCHAKGHKNLGIISCNKCGNAMESNTNQQDEYNKVLNWFISQKENTKYIASCGQREKDKKWWFRLKKNNLNQEEFNKKIRTLVSIGFNVPNFNDEHLSIQLIAEPNDFQKHNSEILICRVCDNILDLSNDLEKASAVKTFHNVHFVKQTTQI